MSHLEALDVAVFLLGLTLGLCVGSSSQPRHSPRKGILSIMAATSLAVALVLLAAVTS